MSANISPSRILRLLVGQVSLTAGLLWLIISSSLPHFRDLFVGAALAGGGLTLLLWRRVRLPVRPVALGALAAGTGGAAAGLLSGYTSTGGMFGWSEVRGWPFGWLGRGGLADSTEEARRQAMADGWGVDQLRLFTDVTLWAYAGLVLIVVSGLVLRRVARSGQA